MLTVPCTFLLCVFVFWVFVLPCLFAVCVSLFVVCIILFAACVCLAVGTKCFECVPICCLCIDGPELGERDFIFVFVFVFVFFLQIWLCSFYILYFCQPTNTFCKLWAMEHKCFGFGPNFGQWKVAKTEKTRWEEEFWPNMVSSIALKRHQVRRGINTVTALNPIRFLTHFCHNV